jgi:hypothetical protein
MRDVLAMGFPRNQVELLFSNPDQEIDDSNHAVDLLIKGLNGWLHRPLGRGNECQICGD